jgi:hypothetical protein
LSSTSPNWSSQSDRLAAAPVLVRGTPQWRLQSPGWGPADLGKTPDAIRSAAADRERKSSLMLRSRQNVGAIATHGERSGVDVGLGLAPGDGEARSVLGTYQDGAFSLVDELAGAVTTVGFGTAGRGLSPPRLPPIATPSPRLMMSTTATTATVVRNTAGTPKRSNSQDLTGAPRPGTARLVARGGSRLRGFVRSGRQMQPGPNL